jgi:hypothetical protein
MTRTIPFAPTSAFVLLATVALLIGCEPQLSALENDETIHGAETPLAGQGGELRAVESSTVDVLSFVDMEVVDGAAARLVRSANAVQTRTNTAELDHHHVMTLWWVIFNNPEYCQGEACGEADLFDGPDGPTNVQPSCIYADGSIVGGNGHARFQDRLKVGETRDSCIDFFVDLDPDLEGRDYGLQNPEGAEIHLVVRSHGPLIPGLVKDQRSTFAGGCEYFLPPGREDLQEGQCSDLQFAVFPAPTP